MIPRRSSAPRINVKRAISEVAERAERARLDAELTATNRQTAQTLTLLETLQSTAPVGFAFVDRDFRYVRVNDILAALNGGTSSEQLGRTVAEVVPALWPRIGDAYRHVLASGEPVLNVEVERETITDPGHIHQSLSSYYPVQVGGQITGVGVVVVDVTERREAETRFQTVVEALIDPLFTMTSIRGDGGDIVDFRYDYVNGAASRMLRLPPDQVIGGHLLEILPAHRSLGLFDAYRKVVETGDPMVREALLYQGTVKGVGPVTVGLDIQAVRLGDGLVATWRDIAPRMDAQEALRRSEERFRSLLQYSSDMILLLDTGGRLLYGSPATVRVLGYELDALLGTSALDLVHPDDLPQMTARFADLVAKPGMSPQFVFRARHSSGGWRWIETIGHNLINNPSVGGIVINARDVTEHVETEAALARSEALLREAQVLTHIGHWQCDLASGRLAWLGDEMFATHGITRGEWKGTIEAALDLVHPDDRAAARQAFGRMLTGQPIDIEHRVLRPDGQIRYVRQRAEPTPGEDVGHVLGVCQDVTEAKAAAMELERTNEELRRKSAEVRSSLEKLRVGDAQRRRLFGAMVTAQEAERRRIATDVHDDSIQVIAAAKIRLSTIRKRIEDVTLNAQLDEFSSLLGESIDRLRHLVFQLRPPSLDREGLEAAFHESLAEWAGEANVTFTVTSELTTPPNTEERFTLFRIGQEALANVRKHAQAQTVAVSVGDVGEGILLRVADDGVGFPKGAPRSDPVGHFGMSNMRERAELAGGWFRVLSPGHGAVVEAWIPVNRAP
jgi:PAS domain S-box-containing protein